MSERDHFGVLDPDGSIILKLNFKIFISGIEGMHVLLIPSCYKFFHDLLLKHKSRSKACYGYNLCIYVVA
jgi:hypothetical protein